MSPYRRKHTCYSHLFDLYNLLWQIFQIVWWHFPYLSNYSMYHDFCRKVLIVWYELNINNHIRTFLLDYQSMAVKQLKYPTMLKGKHNCINLFTLFYKSEYRCIQVSRNHYIYPKEPSISCCFWRINCWNLWIWWKCQWIFCIEAKDESGFIFTWNNPVPFFSNTSVEINAYI